jgi:hypothetical protein
MSRIVRRECRCLLEFRGGTGIAARERRGGKVNEKY